MSVIDEFCRILDKVDALRVQASRLRDEILRLRTENGRMRIALEHIMALRDGYKGGDAGRVSGYRVCGDIAEQALRPDPQTINREERYDGIN